MATTIVAYITLNAIILYLVVLAKNPGLNSFIWIMPLVTFAVFVYLIGRHAVQDKKSYKEILKRSNIFSFSVGYIMSTGGSFMMARAEGHGNLGLWIGLAIGWIIGLLFCLLGVMIVNQFFGKLNRTPNQGVQGTPSDAGAPDA